LKIEIDKSQLAEVKTLLAGVKNGAGKVMMRSINKTLTTVQSESAKEVSGFYNITQKKVKENFTINNA